MDQPSATDTTMYAHLNQQTLDRLLAHPIWSKCIMDVPDARYYVTAEGDWVPVWPDESVDYGAVICKTGGRFISVVGGAMGVFGQVRISSATIARLRELGERRLLPVAIAENSHGLHLVETAGYIGPVVVDEAVPAGTAHEIKDGELVREIACCTMPCAPDDHQWRYVDDEETPYHICSRCGRGEFVPGVFEPGTDY